MHPRFSRCQGDHIVISTAGRPFAAIQRARTYGIDIQPGQNDAFLLAVLYLIQNASRPRVSDAWTSCGPMTDTAHT